MRYLVVLLIFITSCNVQQENSLPEPETGLDQLFVPEGFDYATSEAVSVTINGHSKSSVIFELLDQEGNLLSKGSTSENHPFYTTLELPTYHDTLWINALSIGYPSNQAILLNSNSIEFLLERTPPRVNPKHTGGRKRTTASDYETLGSWDNFGRPDYLEQSPDNISQALLNDIDASLPEGRPVPQYNAEYLVDRDMNTRLQDSAGVWITFVHEGAGWKNTLGFYTYDLNNPPNNKEEITEKYIIFPNVSYNGSGGDLQSGDKVYLGEFQAGTGIGWFLIPNAWNAGTSSVDEKSQIKYSVKSFNDFTSEDFEQHCILFADDVRELILIGFEDTSRPGGDNDFNDAIFYVTANPYTAVITDELQEITESKDTDEDGVLDHLDEYPSDGTKAYHSYSPAANKFGSLAFEDLWPVKGDYDFNDLVLDYQYKSVLSASNHVQEVELLYKIKAIGGLYHNGFGVELPIAQNQVLSVAGMEHQSKYVSLANNGTEQGHNQAVIIPFEDAFELMSPPAGKSLVNAEPQVTYVNPHTLSITVDLLDNITHTSSFSTSAFNPFIIVQGDRGHEVHLPGYLPTSLASSALFGTGDDRHEKSAGQWYTTDENLPWGIHLSRSFDYPIENADISLTHMKFAAWAQSGGQVFTDWYLNRTNYRTSAKIYQKP